MIGNKHFKTWLRGLDPVTRVEKMRDIAQSQSMAGLKGSLIKESLAQLSQRCQVMLIRLSDEEISHYSRKKQVKRLDNPKISISKTKQYTKRHKHKKESLKKLTNKGDDSIFKSPSNHNPRLEQKIRELFGDDPDDHTIAKDTYPKDPISFDKNINQFVSNTFNVNIFKSSSRSCDETNQISAREISSEPNKILRIDFSLCNDDSDVKSNLCSLSTSDSKDSQHKSKSVKQSSKTKRKLSYDSIVPKTKRKKKNHKNHPGSPSEGEDPSIEELWKILGMESPIDRSESIIKSYPLPTQGPSSEHPQDTLNHNVLILSSTTEKTNNSSNKPHEADVTDNGIQNSATSIAESSPQCLENTGPVCKTAKAFNSSSNSHHDAIDDFNAVEVARKLVEEKQTLEKSKVGTIRVRDIGSLMKSPSPHNNVTPVANRQDQPSTSQQPSTSVNCTNQKYSIADQFIVTYGHYFDELVESKIPKMGELLHLAIADLNRKYERIKRAEQLSSDELIVEEKQRAEKEINDMMRVRGVELTSLCETIVNRFDQFSKMSLFIALFVRLLKHAECIDPANKKYTREAKNVMYMMLTKSNFKDKEIVNYLTCDFGLFSLQLDQINGYIRMFDESQRKALHNLNKQLNVPQTNDTHVKPRSVASEPQSLPSKLTPAASPGSNASATIPKLLLHYRLDKNGHLIQNESRPNDTSVRPRSQPTVASESQSITQKPTSPLRNLIATVSQLNRDSVNKMPHIRYNEGQLVRNEPRRNDTLVRPSSQPYGPQSITTIPSSQASSVSNLTATAVSQVSRDSMNNISHVRLDSEGQVIRISPNGQPEKRRGRPTIYKAVIQNGSQTNNRIMFIRQQPTIAVEPQSRLPKTASSVNNPNDTVPQVNNINNVTHFQLSGDGRLQPITINANQEQKQGTSNLATLTLLKNPNNTNYTPVTNAGGSTRSYVLSSTNTLQSRNQPQLATSPVHNGQMADLIIRASPTSVPNNPVMTPRNYPQLYTQSSSNVTSNLTITPRNTRPNIASVSSAQPETVGQKNWQDQNRPGIGLINVPQTPKRSPIIVSSCPTSSTNTQERIVTTVPQVQASISAVESVNTSASSQIDVQQDEQPHGPVPSSSHCHPFVRRMPISGKMRMLFGNPNSMD